MPLVTQIFNAEMKAMGAEVKNHLCPHFEYSRVDLFNIISVRQLKTMDEVMREVGKNPESLGCELCKPTLASIFASLWNRHVMVSARWVMGGDARVAVRDRDRVKLTSDGDRIPPCTDCKKPTTNSSPISNATVPFPSYPEFPVEKSRRID